MGKKAVAKAVYIMGALRCETEAMSSLLLAVYSVQCLWLRCHDASKCLSPGRDADGHHL